MMSGLSKVEDCHDMSRPHLARISSGCASVKHRLQRFVLTLISVQTMLISPQGVFCRAQVVRGASRSVAERGFLAHVLVVRGFLVVLLGKIGCLGS